MPKNCIQSMFALLVFAVVSTSAARAEFNTQSAYDFMAAQTKAYKTGSSEDIEAFVAFLADDVKDVHVAYGREFSGKDFYRKNMPKKAKALISYEKEVTQIVLGTNVVIIIYNESTSEKKRDGQIKDYRGRTIMVVDFNDTGLITQMRRYQD